MIRVLHSVSNMARAGIETMLMNYYRHIDRDVLQFDFLANKPVPGEYDDEIRGLGGRVFVSPGLNPIHYGQYERYVRQIVSETPDLRIVHGHNEAMAYYSLRSARKAGISVRIAHAHNTRIIKDYKYPLKIVCKSLLPGTATEFWGCGRDAGIYYFGEKRWNKSGVIIRNAIDLDRFRFRLTVREEMRRRHGLGDSFVIGHVGRFNIQKNHKRLLEIFRAVESAVPDSRLILIGTGELEEDTRKRARMMGLEDKVIFAGQTGNVGEWYQAMDCFVMPSLFEGLPVVGIEAQAAGLPCVFSDKITDEVINSPKSCRLPLDAGDDIWAERIISLRGTSDRFAGEGLIREAGYDIRVEAVKLQERYIKLAFGKR